MVDQGNLIDAPASEGRTIEHSEVIMAKVFTPEHAGPGGVYAHGGEIIKLMDTAAGVAAVRHSHSPVATLRVEAINFFNPIRVGNYVKAHARLTYTSRSSMEVQVKVTTEDMINEKTWEACTAYFVIVALDKTGKPRKVPSLVISSEEERKRFEAGEERHDTCRLDERFRTLCGID